MQADWSDANVASDIDLERSVSLPDADDAHVLAAAISGRAEVLLTLNRDDFPTRTLGQYGIIRRDPDGLLHEFAVENPASMARVLSEVLVRAEGASGRAQNIRALLKRAGMPRLGKWTLGQSD
jgi:hypothetical protein